MTKYTFNRDAFLKACTQIHIAGSTIQITEEEHASYTAILDEVVDSGMVFVLDQGQFDDDTQHIQDGLCEIGCKMLDEEVFLVDGMLTYFGDSTNEDSAALAMLFLNPPEDIQESPEFEAKPVFMGFAVTEDGFTLVGAGQFSQDGVMLNAFTDSGQGNNDDIKNFICAAAYRSYILASAMLLTGAQQSEYKADEDVA